MTVEDALPFFSPIPVVARKLQTLLDVGLSYIKLGQNATTLSGGEAQRIKLARELSNATPAKHCTYWTNPPPGCTSMISSSYWGYCTACAITAIR